MQSSHTESPASQSGLFKTLVLSTPLTFESAATVRRVLKEASQRPSLSWVERSVCMEQIDKIDQLIARFTEPAPR